MTWWMDNKLRLIQNNLRETDADLDTDRLIGQVKALNANVLMMNAGGIFAFYPSKLEYQYVTPYLKKDLLGEAVEKAHGNGLRFIARFDFSKAHESLFAKKPEWFYRTRNGKEVNYHGIVHTCLNGWYQQEYSLQMIGEVLENYPVDGIFFNMFGYQHWDYSGNHYGPCYCSNCKARFRERSGIDLELYEGPGHELHPQYRQFQEATSKEILEKIHTFVKSRRPQVAICTYNPHRVDIVRHESNTSLTRSYPLWLYSASENVAAVENSWEDKRVSNCCINAVDLTYRFTGVSSQEVEIRLYESIANGSGLDFCIIGVFDGYPDRANLETVRSVYSFHAEHEELFGDLRSMADAVLIKPSAGKQEYAGWFKMLKELHIPFDVVVEERIEAMEEALLKAKAIILPGIGKLSAAQCDCLSRVQQSGVRLVAAGQALKEDDRSLARLFGAVYEGVTVGEHAAYLDVSDPGMFPGLRDRDWIIAPQGFDYMHWEDGAGLGMPFISPAAFGPPERAYGHQPSGRFGLGAVKRGGGLGAFIPWKPGTLYAQYGFEDHKHAMADVIRQILHLQPRITTDAPGCVELFLHGLPDGNLLVQLINLSGFNGTTYMPPIPMSGIRVDLKGCAIPRRLRTLKKPQGLPCSVTEDGISFQVDLKGCYEAVVLEFTHPNESGVFRT